MERPADDFPDETVRHTQANDAAQAAASGKATHGVNATRNANATRAKTANNAKTKRSVKTKRGAKADRPRKPGFVRRILNPWWDRLLGAAAEGSLSAQEEQYASHRTSRDYLWNTIGFASWGVVFPIITIIATQIVGADQAGMFSLAFVTASLLMIVANYGVRTYQVSDLDEKHSFSDYQLNRWVTCAIMVVVGLLYCQIRGYDGEMLLISIGVYLYKMIDGLADVYEGRLQQMDKLYLAGVSLTVRSAAVLVVFTVVLLVSGSLAAASISLAVAAAATFFFVTFPLALLETPKSRKLALRGVADLFRQCFPLFLALFLYSLVDNMPKFAMEGVLSYDNQLYFNALYFPAQAVLMSVGFIYKPLLVRMAAAWADVKHRKRFDLFIFAMAAVIVAVTLIGIALMGWIGIPVMSFLYGIDFEQFRTLSYIMLAAGGVTGLIDFLYQVITVLRKQKVVTKLYLITFGFSLLVLLLLINFTGLPGAVIGYLIVMCILLVLLVWEYIKVRLDYIRNPESDPDAPALPAAGHAAQ